MTLFVARSSTQLQLARVLTEMASREGARLHLVTAYLGVLIGTCFPFKMPVLAIRLTVFVQAELPSLVQLSLS